VSAGDLRIRRGSSADDPVCGRIVGRSLAAGPVPDALPFARAVLTSTAPLPLLPPRRRLLGIVEGLIVGFADLDRGRAVLNYLFVLPEAQGQGVGSALLAAAERVAERPPRLTVLACNAPALAFYGGRGYVELERWQEPDWHGGPVEWLRLGKASSSKVV
jgi:GNAT superfamily N-acetyltransferase